jgi:UDP:flavonoid glycosyltransferase YjiC (YdhE family)
MAASTWIPFYRMVDRGLGVIPRFCCRSRAALAIAIDRLQIYISTDRSRVNSGGTKIVPKPADRPLIYASLGTLQNQQLDIFKTISAACVDLDAQLVISLGDPDRDPTKLQFPGNPIVIAYAPHAALIARSSVVVTHAELNTTIGSLSAGVPLIAIPITNEQPGIATRIVRTGAGEMVPPPRSGFYLTSDLCKKRCILSTRTEVS